MLSDIPVHEGKPLYDAAVEALAAGRLIFCCSVTVGTTSGGGAGVLSGGKISTSIKQWDPSTLIEAVEGLGWRLQHINHVWLQTDITKGLPGAQATKGLVRAQLLFRRGRAGTG